VIAARDRRGIYRRSFSSRKVTALLRVASGLIETGSYRSREPHIRPVHRYTFAARDVNAIIRSLSRSMSRAIDFRTTRRYRRNGVPRSRRGFSRNPIGFFQPMMDPLRPSLSATRLSEYFLCSPSRSQYQHGNVSPRRTGGDYRHAESGLCIVVADNFEISFSVRLCTRRVINPLFRADASGNSVRRSAQLPPQTTLIQELQRVAGKKGTEKAGRDKDLNVRHGN